MGNLKVRVNNEAESKEVQELFFELGYGFEGCKNKTVMNFEYVNPFYFFAYSDNDLTVSGDNSVFSLKLDHKELTIQQLRDLVVLKRNDVNDATHENAMYPYIKLSDGWYYFDDVEKWIKSTGGKPKYYERLKKIEKEMKMKEYLNPSKNYELCLSADDLTSEGMIEVPNGATTLTRSYANIIFWKDGANLVVGTDDCWDCDVISLDKYLIEHKNNVHVIWKRSEAEKQAEACENKPFSQCIPVPESAWDKQTTGMKYDSDKPRYSLLPKGAVNAVIDVLEFGAKKYEADNWQKVDNAKERYYNAAMRHIDKWWNGEKHDPETNIHHLAHASTNLFFLMWFDK